MKKKGLKFKGKLTLDKELNKFDNVILFPEKMEKATESLRNSNLGKFLSETSKKERVSGI